MGYDCTLHAVDEKEIRKKFVPALVSGSMPEKGFSKDDQAMWKQTLKSLAKDSPAKTASIICQLALVFASRFHPYHYERGFALSLWPGLSDTLRSTFPVKLADSPESLFNGLLEKYPRLDGQFPADFSGNWSTGIFVSAQKVPSALKWVDARVKQYAEGDQRLFRGLLLVLQYCARHKLAYWEGTDLPVPLVKMAPEGGKKRRRAERSFKWLGDGFDPKAHRGNVFICEDSLGAGEKKARTAVADFSLWPPKIHWLKEYAIDASFSAAGKLVTIAADPGQYHYTVRLRQNPAAATCKQLALRGSIPVGSTGYYACAFWGEQAVSMLWYERGKSPKRYPLFQQGNQLVEDKNFPPAKDLHKSSFDKRPGDLSAILSRFLESPQESFVDTEDDSDSESEMINVRVARTGDGSEILIWGEHGYELSKKGFQKTFALTAAEPDWTSVPAGRDGFFYLPNHRLHEIHRGAAPISHLPKLTNVREVRPGPEGSLLLREGDNKAGDWGKLYWPQTKLLTRLKPDLIPEVDPDDLHSLYWLEEQQRLLVFLDKEVWFIPWEEIKDLPRSKAD